MKGCEFYRHIRELKEEVQKLSVVIMELDSDDPNVHYYQVWKDQVENELEKLMGMDIGPIPSPSWG